MCLFFFTVHTIYSMFIQFNKISHFRFFSTRMRNRLIYRLGNELPRIWNASYSKWNRGTMSCQHRSGLGFIYDFPCTLMLCLNKERPLNAKYSSPAECGALWGYTVQRPIGPGLLLAQSGQMLPHNRLAGSSPSSLCFLSFSPHSSALALPFPSSHQAVFTPTHVPVHACLRV